MSVKLGGPDRFVGADFLDQERTDSYPPKLSESGFPVLDICRVRVRSSASAGWILPIGSSSRRLLNQSTHSSVAYSTASKDRQGPRRWMTLAL